MARSKTKLRRSRSRQVSPIVTLGLLVGAVVVIIVLFGILSGNNASASTSRSGNTVDFTMNDFNGKPVSLSSYRGHPVLVNLWASWCPPCRAEMPNLVAFYNEHKDEGLILLAVNSTDQMAPAKQFAEQQGMPFPVLFDPQGQAMQLFNTTGLPGSYLIDRKGNIVFSWIGGITTDVLKTKVAPLLSQ